MFDLRPIPSYQQAAVQKYIREKRDTVLAYVPKGYKAVIKKHAKQYQPQEGEPGMAGYVPAGSVSAFVYRAIREAIERDLAASGNGSE